MGKGKVLSYRKMPTNNYKRNDPSFGKLLFSKHHHNIFRHESSMDANTNKKKFDEERIFRVSNHFSIKSLLITKGKIVTL